MSRKSTKEVRIISGGNLVVKELYVYRDAVHGFAMIEQNIFGRDLLGHLTNISRWPAGASSPQVLYQADWIGTNSFPGDRKLFETDKSGIKTLYTYDSLKRLKTSVKEAASIAGYPSQSAITTAFDYDASGNVLTNTTSAGALSLKTMSAFDRAGRLTNSISVDGLATTYQYVNGGRQTNITYSSSATQILENYLDRRTKSVTGTAVVNQFFDYSRDPNGSIIVMLNPKNIKTITNGTAGSGRWEQVITDTRDRQNKEVKPGFRSSYDNYTFSDERSPGALIEHVDRASWDEGEKITTWYDRDEFGSIIATATDADNASPEHPDTAPTGVDRLTESNEYFEADAQTNWFKVTEELTYPTAGSGTSVLVSRTKERLTGFTAGQLSQTYTYDADTNLTTVTVSVVLSNKTVTTVTTNAQSSLPATEVTVNGLAQWETTPTVAGATWHYYDALGRETGTQDPLGFSTGTVYATTNSQVLARSTKTGTVFNYSYYAPGHTNAGQLYSESGPTGKKTYHAYNLRGQEIQTWGDVPYPVQKIYNEFGDLATNITYRSTAVSWNSATWPSPSGGDVTKWLYDGPTGLLTNKLDAAGQGEKYDYYPNHMPKATILARGIGRLTTYAANGDLVQIDLTNSWTGSTVVSSVISSNYSRMGMPRAIYDDAGLHNLSYDYAGRLITNACTNGLLNGTVLTYHYDPMKGKDRLNIRVPSSAILTNQYGFDSYGRISSVSDGGAFSVTYGYLPNSDLLQTTTFKNNSTTRLVTTRTWDFGSRLRSIVSTTNGVAVIGHNYIYDALDRRTQAYREDSSFWLYGYDDRDELVRGHHYWSDWAPVAGQRFEYQYDAIGNLTNALSGGDTSGANLRPASYTVNNLNQFTNAVTPGYKDIAGVAYATSTVTVNSGSTDRKGEFFHRELSISNGSSPVWQTVTATTGGTSSNGGFVLPKNSQPITYDADGNLSFDGIWNYQWTVENRLASMNMTNTASGLANSNRLKLDFVYDHEGKRVAKVVSTWNGSSFIGPVTNRFVYDGWRPVVQLGSTGYAQYAYLWGMDLSGSLDDAGGIGGLVAFIDTGGTAHFAANDGNGNVMALINPTDSSLDARYEYSPFLEPIRVSGNLGNINSIWGSSKFWDREAGLSYYGERYLGNGRWLSRDPMGEEGGVNLYAFVGNNPLNDLDPTGLNTLEEEEEVGSIAADSEGGAAREAITLKNKVKDAFDTFSDFQDAITDLWDIADLSDDFLENALRQQNEALSESLRSRGWKPETHHVATNKGGGIGKRSRGGWKEAFEQLFSMAGFDLNSPINQLPLPGHYGSHKANYHAQVSARLQKAVQGIDPVGGFKTFRKALVRELNDIKRDLLKNPGMIAK